MSDFFIIDSSLAYEKAGLTKAHAEGAAGYPGHVGGQAIFWLATVPLDVRPQRRHGVSSSRAHPSPFIFSNLAASLNCAQMVSVSTSCLLIALLSGLFRSTSRVNLKLTANPNRFWSSARGFVGQQG
jgi:hypothetical protein